MAGKKYGAVMQVNVRGSYFALPQKEQDVPGEVMAKLMQKYAGKVDMVRRYWTRSFNADVTDVFVIEFDDPAEYHAMGEEMLRAMATSGDPDRYGETVSILFGVNPDAD